MLINGMVWYGNGMVEMVCDGGENDDYGYSNNHNKWWVLMEAVIILLSYIGRSYN